MTLLSRGAEKPITHISPNEAIAVSITNKCFDEYEYALVRDVALTRFA